MPRIFRLKADPVQVKKTTSKTENPEPSEHEIQKAFTEWAEWAAIELKGCDLYHSIPNAGKRSHGAANWFVAEGMKKGVVDTQIPVARGGFIGLAIEFKTLDTSESADQRRRNNRLQQEGWAVFVCRSFEAARRVTLGYFGCLQLAIPEKKD